MSNRIFHPVSVKVAEHARVDAERLTPGFSETLHARVTQAVDRAEVPMLKITPAVLRSPARYWVTPLALAATVALVIVPTLLVPSHRNKAVSNNPPGAVIVSRSNSNAVAHQRTEVAVYATAHEVKTKVQDVVETAMAQDQFAGLDHDFRSATEYLVNQVPLRSTWESAAAQGER